MFGGVDERVGGFVIRNGGGWRVVLRYEGLRVAHFVLCI